MISIQKFLLLWRLNKEIYGCEMDLMYLEMTKSHFVTTTTDGLRKDLEKERAKDKPSDKVLKTIQDKIGEHEAYLKEYNMKKFQLVELTTMREVVKKNG